jgi:hypothetical protein
MKTGTKRTFGMLLALVAWMAVVVNYFYSGEKLCDFLSYFTIISNTSIALAMTLAGFAPKSTAGRFVSRPAVLSALALYIVIVALVYNINLRNTWAVSGMLSLTDYFIHVFIPLAYVAYWFMYTPKKALRWKNVILWLVLPLLYLTYSLTRGAITSWYPYPFLNVTKLGYPQVLINSAVVTLGFVLIGLLLVLINRK